MGPLSHIYVSTKVVKRNSDLLVFGSVLPDFSWTSKTSIGSDQIHYNPSRFYDFIKNNYPEFTNLGLGARLHSDVDKGADFYSDDTQKGFAKVKGKYIENDISKLLGEEKSEKTLQLAHTYIEVGVDILLNIEDSNILEMYKQSVNTLDLNKIADCISDYLNIDSSTIQKEIQNFINIVGPNSYSSIETLHENLLSYIKLSRGKNVDLLLSRSILQKAQNIMENKYQKYLDSAIQKIRVDTHV